MLNDNACLCDFTISLSEGCLSDLQRNQFGRDKICCSSLFVLPSGFNIKRVLVRSAIVCFVLLICLAVPRFGIVLNLFGGSTITALSFIFPPLMYLWLVDMKSEGAWNDMWVLGVYVYWDKSSCYLVFHFCPVLCKICIFQYFNDIHHTIPVKVFNDAI